MIPESVLMQHTIYLMCVSIVTQLLVVSKDYPAFTGGRTDISHLWKSTLYGQITNTHFSDTGSSGSAMSIYSLGVIFCQLTFLGICWLHSTVYFLNDMLLNDVMPK